MTTRNNKAGSSAMQKPKRVPVSKLIRDIATVAEVSNLMASGAHKHQIKRYLAERCMSDVSPRTVERVMADARELIKHSAKASKADMAAEALAFYRAMKADPNTPPRDRIKAQECIDHLLGLSARYTTDAEKTDSASDFARKAHEAMQAIRLADMGGEQTAAQASGKDLPA